MIEELEGTLADTLRLLAAHTLDPRDETVFVTSTWSHGRTVWELQGGFLDSDRRFHFRHTGTLSEIEEVIAAIRANRLSAAYGAAWRSLVPRLDEWLRIGHANPWIRDASDPPFTERSFALCRTAEQMASAVDRNNWGLGSAFVLADADVCMIQQCDGPGEFLMIRGAAAFDSWSTGRPYIHGERLVAYLRAVASAPLDPDGKPLWYDLVSHLDEERTGPRVAETAAGLRRLLG